MVLFDLKARRQRKQDWKASVRERGRQVGRARGAMAQALGDERVLAQGTVWVDGDGGDHAYDFTLTVTRLLWNRTADMHVGGFSLANVVQFRMVPYRSSGWRFELTLVDGSKTAIFLLPTTAPPGVIGTPRYEHYSLRFQQEFAGLLHRFGARQVA